MRIISGKYKGRVIQMPKGIRPTQDKVRKALFDILGDIEGLSFLELYAGSGAVGFEAVSRGVRELVLVEYNRDCLLAIKKNIDSLKVKACSLYPQEVQLALKAIHDEARKFDLIFLDPPYQPEGDYSAAHIQGILRRYRSRQVLRDEGLAKKTLQILGAYDIVAPNGFIIVQHFKREILPQKVVNLALCKQARYGDTTLSFYRKISPNVPESDISR